MSLYNISPHVSKQAEMKIDFPLRSATTAWCSKALALKSAWKSMCLCAPGSFMKSLKTGHEDTGAKINNTQNNGGKIGCQFNGDQLRNNQRLVSMYG